MELVNLTKSRLIVSDELLYCVFLLKLWGFGQVMCVFGIVVNVLTIATYVKQGVKDTINMSSRSEHIRW